METINIESIIRVSIKGNFIVPKIIQVFAFQNTFIQIGGVSIIDGWAADGSAANWCGGVSAACATGVGLELMHA